MTKLLCETCSADISERLTTKYTPRFCSKKCQGAAFKTKDTVEFICQHCQSHSILKRSQVFKKDKIQKYCSQKCAAQAGALAARRTVDCAFCQETFIDKRGTSANTKYCGNQCKFAHRYLQKRIVRECPTCKLPYMITKYKFENTKIGKYCCKTCAKGNPDSSEALKSFQKPSPSPSSYEYVFLDGKKQAIHRLTMEEFLGRALYPHENVHHINGDRSDNRIENLELWSKSQPSGQRVSDKVKWAREILDLYG